MHRYFVRQASFADLEAIFRLARLLNTMNLPNKLEALPEVLERSEKSFSGAILDPLERQYCFVLEELQTGQVVGSSQVIARHGDRHAPHIFFDVYEVEHYSKTIDKLFRHKALRLGFNYDGPTEVGGLIVDPTHRSASEHLGKQLSFVRFLFIAMNRDKFRDRVLAELMPPMMPDGRSELWEALGRRFTGMGYEEADFLSRTNKEFIRSLFPEIPIYTALFNEQVQTTIGAVGRSSEPAHRLLTEIGFEYQNRVDPFDGGPHFGANIDDVSPVKHALRVTLEPCRDNDLLLHQGQKALVCVFQDAFTAKARFRAIQTLVHKVSTNKVEIEREAFNVLSTNPGSSEAWVYFL